MHTIITLIIAETEVQEIVVWLLIFLALYLAGRAVLTVIWHPRRPELLTSVEIAASMRDRKSVNGCVGGKCGFLVACRKHSAKYDEIDEELESRGK